MSAALLKKISATQYAKIVPASVGHTESVEDRLHDAEQTLDQAKSSDQHGNFLNIDGRFEYTEGRVVQAVSDSEANATSIININSNRVRDLSYVAGSGPIPADIKKPIELMVTQNPDSSLLLDVSPGIAFINGRYVITNETQTIELPPDEFTNRRIDYVVLNTAGQAIVVEGPDTGLEPEMPDDVIPLARIQVEPAPGKIAEYELNTGVPTNDTRNVLDGVNRDFYVMNDHIPVSDITPMEFRVDGYLQPAVNYVFNYEEGHIFIRRITISEHELTRTDERTFNAMPYVPMFQGRVYNEAQTSVDENTVDTTKNITTVIGVFLESDPNHESVNYFLGGSFLTRR